MSKKTKYQLEECYCSPLFHSSEIVSLHQAGLIDKDEARKNLKFLGFSLDEYNTTITHTKN